MKKKPNQNPNLIKNEFMWEEPKKKVKLYKNWKLYAIALPVIAIGAGTGSGIYYGVNGHPKKADLSTLHLNTQAITGVEGKNETDAFQAFLRHNENISDLENKVEVGGFTPPWYTQNGNLTIKAKANSGCKGEVAVMIDALGQVSLDDLIKTNLEGIENMSQDQAFAAFLNNQTQNLADLKEMVILDFNKPSYTEGGSLVITAKPDTKYVGTITITISKLVPITLSSLNKTAIPGVEDMSENDAFNAFLKNNKAITDLQENAVLEYSKPGYATSGLLTITAKPDTKYTGSIKITINAIEQKSLDSLHLNTSLSIPVTNQQAAFDLFIRLNPEVSDLRDNVQITDFTAPDSNQTGLLEVQAKADTKYSGTLTIDIPELIKTDIARFVTNTTIQGTTSMTVDEAFQALLIANSSWSNLSDYVDYDAASFAIPSSTTDGSLVITAKLNTEYSGRLTIKIEKTIDLNTLNRDVVGVENMTQAQAFAAFLENNKGVTDLEDNIILKDFSKPDYQNSGKLTITAKPNTKYDGEITINIVKLEKTLLSSLKNLNLNLTTSYTNEVDAFNAFLKNNATFVDLEANVKMGKFVASNYGVPGSLEIVATPEGKYDGMVKVEFEAMQQRALSTLIQDTLVGTKGMSEDDAFQAFLTNNPGVTDLKDNVSITFNEPDYDKEGSLVITAKPNTKYIGTITIKITGVDRIELDGLTGLNKDFPGTEEVSDSANGDIALSIFLDANKNSYPDLNDNVKTTSFDPPTDAKTGLLKIEGINKYKGSIEITFSKIQDPTPEKDREIVDTIVNNPDAIKFDAQITIGQKLNDFFEGVIHDGEHQDKPHWYLEGQLEKYSGEFSVLKEVDPDKFIFLGLYQLDEKTQLTDDYISDLHPKAGMTVPLRVKFDYGTIKGQFVSFTLSFKTK